MEMKKEKKYQPLSLNEFEKQLDMMIKSGASDDDIELFVSKDLGLEPDIKTVRRVKLKKIKRNE
jgi:hypothetical protein